MATYNGAKYIAAQMNSILDQIGPEDEVVVTDDKSTDNTCEIIKSFADPRIKLHINPIRLGHVQNFAKAMSLASGDFIALSDQDDIWADRRLEKMLTMLKPLSAHSLVIGDFCEINDLEEPLAPRSRIGKSPAKMGMQLGQIFLGKAKYFGCTFVFRKELRDLVLPIPAKIEAHDLWIAMNSCLYGKIVHCEDITLFRRIHGQNLTPTRRRSLYKIFRSRVIYSFQLLRSALR